MEKIDIKVSKTGLFLAVKFMRHFDKRQLFEIDQAYDGIQVTSDL